MRITILIILLLLPLLGQARDRNQVRLFRATHPCPATQSTKGACVGWVVDHLKPLCAGGLDAPVNMTWSPLVESRKKDREELALCRELRKQARLDSNAKPDLCLVSKRAQWLRLTKILCVDSKHEAGNS